MDVRFLSLSCLGLGLCAGPASTQGTWNFRSLTTSPPANSPAMAFDSLRNVSVLTVANPLVNRAETWELGGTSWQLRSTTGPSTAGLQYTALVFDENRGVAVLVGGQTTFSLLSDTWEWNGTAWTNALANPAPSIRMKHGMAYDAARRVTVLFGGLQDGTYPNAGVYRDTWLWDGQAWVLRNPVTAPAARHGHAMAYDSVRQRVVLFGGNNRILSPLNPNPRTFGDTWEWDGTNWFQVQSQIAPPARQEAGMAYDSRAGLTILFGGLDANGNPLGDTWAWDGTNWRELLTASAPAQRYDPAMAYDGARGTSVLFGGSVFDASSYVRDTWEFTPGTPASYTAFGAGCAGSRGTPVLDARLGSRPIGGKNFSAQVSNLPLTAPAFLFVGLSRTQYGPLSLPFDLTPLGMPGCSLHASGDFLFPVTNVLGSGLWSFDIPLSISGQHFYNQAVVFDPPANPAALTMSNAADALVGY